MTILAIMSIVLALTGVCFTAIREIRASLSQRVAAWNEHTKQALAVINNGVGPVERGCADQKQQKEREKKRREAETNNKWFNFSQSIYNNLIWIPILVLGLVALLFLGVLMYLSPDEWRNKLTSPTDQYIYLLKYLLVIVAASAVMSAILGFLTLLSMRANKNRILDGAGWVTAMMGNTIQKEDDPPAQRRAAQTSATS
jgi:hypothetical protein